MFQPTFTICRVTRIVFTLVAVLALALINQAAEAQESVTFTRDGVSASSVVFTFNSLTGNNVSFDQLGSDIALTQFNDSVSDPGIDIVASGPITSIGIVELFDELTFGDSFGTTDFLDLGSDTESLFIGFSAADDSVGYFELNFLPNEAVDTEFDIEYSDGFFVSEPNQSLSVGAVTVPEPSSLLCLTMVSVIGLMRRRR